MKVLCIDKGDNFPITIGKYYNVSFETEFCYEITDDSNIIKFFNKQRFKTQTEIREEKLNKLLK